MYKYSFIIPHHNTPDLLNRCLCSIPLRDDIQVIVVDDNSNEDLKPHINRTGTEIVYVDKKSSRGAGHARNVGMKIASGEWLLFADCDDYYSQGFVDILDDYSSTNIDVLYFNFNYLDGVTGQVLPDLPFSKTFEKFDGSPLYVDEVKFHHNVPWTKMVKRDLVVENKIYFEEVVNGNDILFSLRTGYHARTITVEKRRIYNYLRTPNSILTKTPTVDDNLCRILHCIKLNQVYIHLSHPEWRKSTLSLIKSKYDNGHKMNFALLLLYLIIYMPKILISRNEWLIFFSKS